MIYIGIDNGVSGGIVALSDCPGVGPIATLAMPTQRRRNRDEVDVRELHKWCTDVTGGNLSNAVFVIEEPGGSKSAKAATSMAGSFHAIRGFLDAKFLPWHPVTPRQWQKEMLPGVKPGDTKPAALAAARRIWPHLAEESWMASPRCRKPHDGIIDAALIAEYARRKGL